MRRMSSEHALSSSISFSLLPSCMELLISLAGKIITEGAFLSSAEVIICSLTGVTRHPWSFLPPVGCPPVPQLGIGGIKTGCLTHLFMPFFKTQLCYKHQSPGKAQTASSQNKRQAAVRGIFLSWRSIPTLTASTAELALIPLMARQGRSQNSLLVLLPIT